jgi:hypothetical protein
MDEAKSLDPTVAPAVEVKPTKAKKVRAKVSV